MSYVGRRLEDKESNDFFPTPPILTQRFLARERFSGCVLEPACGEGHISEILKKNGYRVESSDLVDRGYGKIRNFLKREEKADNIVTNPPFKLANEFILHSLKLSHHKVAMFLRLPILQGGLRYNTIFKPHPPSKIYLFVNRPSLIPLEKRKKKNSGKMVPYVWLVWDKKYRGPTTFEWIPGKV